MIVVIDGDYSRIPLHMFELLTIMYTQKPVTVVAHSIDRHVYLVCVCVMSLLVLTASPEVPV